MTILSSDTLAAVQFSASPGAQQRSVGRAVCPEYQVVYYAFRSFIGRKTHPREQKATQVDRLPDHQESVLPRFDVNPIRLFVYHSTQTQRSLDYGATNLNEEFRQCEIQIHEVSAKGIECRAVQQS